MIKTQSVMLDNKVRLVLSEDKSKNQTYAEIIVNYGGKTKKFKKDNKTYNIPEGIAHLLEHTIVEDNIYGNMFDYLKEQYVEFNARTSMNYTSFYINTVYDFERHLEELIKIVNVPVFSEEKMLKIKQPIIEEIKRGKDRTYQKLTEKLNECTYRNIKFQNCLGTPDDIKNVKCEFVKLVYDVFYQYENQTIFISGNFDTKKIIKLIEKTYHEINKKTIPYTLLDKKEIAKVKRKKGHVVDPEFDEFINITFKVDISKLTAKEKVKSTFYINHFLDYNFNDSSKIYKELSDKKDTIYSIDRGVSFNVKDLLIIDIGMYGTKIKRFKKLVFDVFKNKYVDEEMFELWKKDTLIEMILRESYAFRLGVTFLDNILKFDYNEPDRIEDIENFSLEDYENFLNKLDFKNYSIVIQTKK